MADLPAPLPAPLPVLRYLAEDLDELLAVADAELAVGYRGDTAGRQPVHTAYVPAHRFDPGTVRQWGTQAIGALDEFVRDTAGFASAFGLSPELAEQVRPLVMTKLAREPIEDLRIDFEDGYGTRSDDTEDSHARAAARSLRELLSTKLAPPFSGIRCKSLERATRRRAIGTIDAFLRAFGDGGAELGAPVITLPKVTSVAQVIAMNMVCERFEAAYGFAHQGWLRYEIQVEMPQLIVGADGAATIARCVQAGRGRLTGLHYGTYDYSAAVGVSAGQQSLDHPAADYAKSVMQAAAAGTGVRLCDGSSNLLPVGTRAEVTRAWQSHVGLVRRSLERGFYQGWDLHPAQLVSRYAATYGFYRQGLDAACERLRAYGQRAAAGLEEPATGRALAGYLLRGLFCGAFADSEVTARTGLEKAQIMAAARHGQLP